VGHGAVGFLHEPSDEALEGEVEAVLEFTIFRLLLGRGIGLSIQEILPSFSSACSPELGLSPESSTYVWAQLTLSSLACPEPKPAN